VKAAFPGSKETVSEWLLIFAVVPGWEKHGSSPDPANVMAIKWPKYLMDDFLSFLDFMGGPGPS
jgi:hypothetical protein